MVQVPDNTKYVTLSGQAAIILHITGSKRATARQLGIEKVTIDNWLKRPDFRELCEEAKALLESACLSVIMADKSWQSKAWILERLYKEKYAERKEQNVSGNVTVNMVADIGNPGE